MNFRGRFSLVLPLLIATALAASGCARKKPAAAGPRTIAVEVAQVQQGNVPIWLTGIGNVQAYNSVTVRPRVSGELKEVNFTEGQEVKAGTVLARIDPRPYVAALARAEAQVAESEAQLANSRREFARVQDLVTKNVESRQILDQREAAVDQTAALVLAARAAADEARLNLDFTTVRAPLDGHTGVRRLDAGNLVTADQSQGLVVITQTKPIALVFTLPQQFFLDLRRGILAKGDTALPVEALDDNGRVLAQGRLELVDNQIDTSTGTLRLKAVFPNDDQTLWPGQFVSARVLVQTLPGALTVPSEAVQPGVKDTFVYLLKEDSTVEARTVKAGPAVAGMTVIESGLAAGDRVVREGQNKLEPGARVTPASKAAAPAVTTAASQ